MVARRLNELAEQYGNLPVTFGDGGQSVRDVQFLVVPGDSRTESTVEFVIVGW